MVRKDIPDHVTYDASKSSYPRVVVWALGFWGIPSPKRRDLRADPPSPNSPTPGSDDHR